MKKNISFSQFTDAFQYQNRKDQFTYEGFCALFNHLNRENGGDEYTLDVLALCREYTEYVTSTEAAQAYGWKNDEPTDNTTKERRALEYLRDNTTVLEVGAADGIIIKKSLIQQPVETRQKQQQMKHVATSEERKQPGVMKIEIEIDEGIADELQYLVDLHQAHGAANLQESIEGLLSYLAAAVADGSRSPDSWERQILEMMGLVAECDEHNEYRVLSNGGPAHERPMRPADR